MNSPRSWRWCCIWECGKIWEVRLVWDHMHVKMIWVLILTCSPHALCCFPVDPSLSANSNDKRINLNLNGATAWPIACNVRATCAKVDIVNNLLLELWRWFLVVDPGDCWFLTVLIFGIKNDFWFLTVLIFGISRLIFDRDIFCKQCHDVTFCYLEVGTSRRTSACQDRGQFTNMLCNCDNLTKLTEICSGGPPKSFKDWLHILIQFLHWI